MSGIGIVLNPHSRSNRFHPDRVDKLGFIVGDKGSCHETQNIEDISELAETFKKNDIEILGISGGDGTIHRTLSVFIDVYGDTPLPKIALLRGGTMNAVASSLGIHGSPEEILSHLIVSYHGNEAFNETHVSLLKVNGKYGFIFGMGMVSRFIKKYKKKPGNMMWAGWLLLKTMVQSLLNTRSAFKLFERFDAEISVNGKKWPFQNYSGVFAGTVTSIGFGFKPLFRAAEKNDFFHVRGFSVSPRKLLFNVPQLFMGRSISSSGFIDDISKSVKIKLTSPHSFMLDGDLWPETDSIEIEAGPRLTIVQQG